MCTKHAFQGKVIAIQISEEVRRTNRLPDWVHIFYYLQECIKFSIFYFYKLIKNVLEYKGATLHAMVERHRRVNHY